MSDVHECAYMHITHLPRCTRLHDERLLVLTCPMLYNQQAGLQFQKVHVTRQEAHIHARVHC